jgi:hypothetical protein
MDLTTQRRCLGAIAGGLLIGTAGAILWSLSGIDASVMGHDPTQGQRVQPAIPSEINAQPYDASIAAKSLRGPLYDPPPPPTQRVEQPKPPPSTPPKQTSLDITLVGTIIEASQSVAILSDSSGKFDIKGIGESLELSPPGITLKNIESEQVTVQYQGRESTLQLDRSRKKPTGGAGGKRANNRRRNQ